MKDYMDTRLSPLERAEKLLRHMTLREKVAQMDMIRGVELAEKVHEHHFCAVDPESDFLWDRVETSIGEAGMGFVHDVYSSPVVLNKLQHYFVEKTRLGIPCIFTGEALHGINYPGCTIFPMPLNLGAAFDPELTEKVGHAIAAETRSLGITEILAPNLDLAREPRWGRMEETFGEDTHLSSRMAAAIVKGEQGDDVSKPDAICAEPKHYCVHGIAESGLNCAPARVGQREVETAYLPVFEAGIAEAGAYNAMASYNCIDGETVMDSHYYLTEILRGRWGMRGYVRSDFGGINRLRIIHHETTTDRESIRRAVMAGVDVQGFDYPNSQWQDTLIDLVESGDMPESRIDEAVTRILRVKFELGLFENPYTDEERFKSLMRCEAHNVISLEAARKSLTLIKNDGILPLAKDGKKVAVIGPSSGRQRVGSYTPGPYGYTPPSVAEELQRLLPDAQVRQMAGCNISEWDVHLVPAGWFVNGVHLEYFDNDCFAGEPVGEDTASRIKFNWILAKPCAKLRFNNYSVRMTADIKVNTHDFQDSESFLGQLIFGSRDSVRVKLDGQTVIDSFGDHKLEQPSCQWRFENGRVHHLEVEVVVDAGGNMQLFIDSEMDSMEDALQLAAESDLTVLVCGDDVVTSGEGMDRCELKLYGRQRELVRRAALLGKPCVLVLETGKSVDISEEAPNMNAVIWAGFAGEFGATAIAEALVGDFSPAGRLPVSFPRSVGHLPCYYSQLPGNCSDRYLEAEPGPLYAFGHGLSYTTFAYRDLRVEKVEGHNVTVALEVENTGKVAADEVVQLYVQDVESSIVTPDKELKAFKRITLAPGEVQTVRLQLNERSFRLMDRRFNWVIEEGVFRLMAGASSEDIRCEVDIALEGETL